MADAWVDPVFTKNIWWRFIDTASVGGVVVAMKVTWNVFGDFPGLSVVTEAGDEPTVPVGGEAGALLSVVRFGVVHATLAEQFDAPAGSTTVRVALAGVGGGGDYMELVLGASVTSGSTVVGAFDCVQGNDLYFYVTDEGDHQDLQLFAEVQVR